MIFGGGAPKNFLLQTEPQLQEILGVSEKGHDYFIQITDARPDTGGLSGATPAEAVSWGKIDPEQLPDTVVCYLDSTIAMPLMASYVLARCKPRKPRRLYKRLQGDGGGAARRVPQVGSLQALLARRRPPTPPRPPPRAPLSRQAAPPHAAIAAPPHALGRPSRRLGVKSTPCSTTSHR